MEDNDILPSVIFSITLDLSSWNQVSASNYKYKLKSKVLHLDFIIYKRWISRAAIQDCYKITAEHGARCTGDIQEDSS